MLDLTERPLRAEGIAFVRLDGSMSQPAKDEALRRFATDADVRVMLLSLKAGGVGLNLVSAQTVYLLDPWTGGTPPSRSRPSTASTGSASSTRCASSTS